MIMKRSIFRKIFFFGVGEGGSRKFPFKITLSNRAWIYILLLYLQIFCNFSKKIKNLIFARFF